MAVALMAVALVWPGSTHILHEKYTPLSPMHYVVQEGKMCKSTIYGENFQTVLGDLKNELFPVCKKNINVKKVLYERKRMFGKKMVEHCPNGNCCFLQLYKDSKKA